mgnify:CR=1 FL=1
MPEGYVSTMRKSKKHSLTQKPAVRSNDLLGNLKRGRFPALGIFLLITAIWLVLYLPHLRTSPPWYNDETLTHKTAMDLVHGQATLYGMWGTFWHPHNPYQPFYHLLAGLFGLATNGDILGSRFFNALLAWATALAIHFIGRRSLGRMPSLFAALMFLVYDQSVIHFRMTYAHNLCGLGILIMTLFLLRPASRRNDLRAGLGLALAAGAHPLFIHAATAGGISRIKHWKSFFPLFLPAGLMVGLSLGLNFLFQRQWLFDDLSLLKYTFFSRAASDGTGAKAIENLWFFLRQDWFHSAIALGLLVSARRRLYPILFVGGFVLFMLVKNRQNLTLFYYQAIIILPTLCLAWASLFIFIRKSARRYNRLAFLPGKQAACLLFLLPLIGFFHMFPLSLSGKVYARCQYWATQSAEEVEELAKWINERTTETDFVPCANSISWLLKAKTANYLQIVTWYGYPTQGYDFGNKRERFRYDVSLENARYAIVGDHEKKWAFNEPNVNELVKKLQNEKWPTVWRGSNYVILENPKYFANASTSIDSSPSKPAPLIDSASK